MILGQLLLLASNYKWRIWPDVSMYLWMICLGYLIFIVLLNKINSAAHQHAAMLFIDLLLWAAFFAFLDGVSNPLIWCLLLPALLASLSQSPAFTWVMTILSNLLYLGLWKLGVHEQSLGVHGAMMSNHIMGMWLGFIVISLLLTWVTTTLMVRLKNKNQALIAIEQQRQADETIIKMATLATSLAHELGTPLASIKLLTDELKHATFETDVKKDLSILDTQVTRCKQVLQELTTVTDRDRPDDYKSVAVSTFINELHSNQTDNSFQVTVENHLNREVNINVDELFRLACLNVINNSKAAGAKEMTIALFNTEESVLIKLKDEGAGKKHQNRDGLGIGLKLSARIISAMGGEFDFMVKDKGAETRIKVPINHG